MSQPTTNTQLNDSVIRSIHRTLLTLLTQENYQFSSTNDELTELAQILSEGEAGSDHGEQGQTGAMTSKPRLVRKIDERLQLLLALMATNQLSPEQRKELVKKLSQSQDLLKAVVKAHEKGMPGANEVLRQAYNTLSSDVLNKMKPQIQFISPQVHAKLNTTPSPHPDR